MLRSAFADVEGITGAFIFGSEASGTATPESDIDVFVLVKEGDVPELRRIEQTVAQRAVEASLAIGREVNVIVRTPKQLADKIVERRVFYERVMAGPKHWIIGDHLALQGRTAIR